jgi:hypothetical protein
MLATRTVRGSFLASVLAFVWLLGQHCANEGWGPRGGRVSDRALRGLRIGMAAADVRRQVGDRR